MMLAVLPMTGASKNMSGNKCWLMLVMCMQLDELAARLCNPRSKSGQSEMPMPVHVTSAFSGHLGGYGDIKLSSTAMSSEEGSRLKIDWIRRGAPMAALHKAVEALLEAFWAQGPHQQACQTMA